MARLPDSSRDTWNKTVQRRLLATTEIPDSAWGNILRSNVDSIGENPNNGWEIPDFDELIECKFLEDTYDVMSCMQDVDAWVFAGECRGMRGLWVMPSMIGLEKMIRENVLTFRYQKIGNSYI